MRIKSMIIDNQKYSKNVSFLIKVHPIEQKFKLFEIRNLESNINHNLSFPELRELIEQ